MLKLSFHKFTLIILSLCISNLGFTQFNETNVPIDDGDFNVGGDIFSDFNEDIDSAQIEEDERFFRYGRYFSFNLGLGLTQFDGNRGAAYDDTHPSFNVFYNAFINFQNSFTLGIAYSRHFMDVTGDTIDFPTDDGEGIGIINVDMLRFFLGWRYYLDTSNLGTALTYSHPYFTCRLEYWYQTNKFTDPNVPDPSVSGGGIGFAIGGGLEFPLKVRESYINLELLVHSANLFDKETDAFVATAGNNGYNVEDLRGNIFTFFINYVIQW